MAVAAAAAECEYNCGRGCDDMAVVVHGQSCTKSWLTASCVISRVTYRLPCMDEMHGWSAQIGVESSLLCRLGDQHTRTQTYQIVSI